MRCLPSALVVAFLVGASGCSLFSSPSGADLSQRVQSDAKELVEETSTLDKELGELVAAIDSITDNGDLLEPKFVRLKKSIRNVRREVGAVEGAHAGTRKHQTRYEKVWTSTLEGYKDAGLRGKAQSRLQVVSANFQKQDEVAQELTEAAAPLLEQLTDIQKFLASDLSEAGIESIASDLSGARAKAAALRKIATRLGTTAEKAIGVLGTDGVVRR